jgi:hypothetical protein
MYQTKPMHQIRREMHQRKHATRINLKQAAIEYTKGIAVVLFIFATILGWQIALNAPTCTVDYHSGVTQCV